MSEPSGSAPKTERARPLRAIGAAVAVILIVAVAVAVLLLRDDEHGTATDSPASPASPTVSTTAFPSPHPSASPSTSPAGPSPSEDARALVPEDWTAAGTFSESGKLYVVGDLVTWSGGLVAVGTRYEQTGRGVFGPPPQHTGSVWRSTDGNEWTDATPAGTFVNIELRHLFETADGALLVIGDSWNGTDRTSAAWQTIDGASWEPLVLNGLPANAWVARVASGARGHLATVNVGGEARSLHSTDGRSWVAVLTAESGTTDVGAGDEGFVAAVSRGDPASPSTAIVASSDGLVWFDATTPVDDAWLVAPRGADWLAVTTAFGDPLENASWASQNGLDWRHLADLSLASMEFPGASCSEFPAALHGLPAMVILGTTLSYPCSEGAVVAAGSSYASADGIDWTPLPFGDHAFAAGAVMAGDRVVVATDAQTNLAEEAGVTFWISEAP